MTITKQKLVWTLWRQDDNGSSAIIDRFENEADARQRAEELEARGHKQHYWVRPASDTDSQVIGRETA